jgi:hypothetical protein
MAPSSPRPWPNRPCGGRLGPVRNHYRKVGMCAEAHSETGEGKLEPDVAAELFTDEQDWPTNPIAIRGLLARTAREGIWRLHRSGDSQEYVEFMEEGVLGSRRLERRGTEVSLRPNAEIVHFRTRRAKASDVVWGGSMRRRMSVRPLHPLDPNLRRPYVECHVVIHVFADDDGNVWGEERIVCETR